MFFHKFRPNTENYLWSGGRILNLPGVAVIIEPAFSSSALVDNTFMHVAPCNLAEMFTNPRLLQMV